MSWLLFGGLRALYFPIDSPSWALDFLYLGYRGDFSASVTGGGYALLLLVPILSLSGGFLFKAAILSYRKAFARKRWWSDALSFSLAVAVSGSYLAFLGGEPSGSGLSLVLARQVGRPFAWIGALIGYRLLLTAVSFGGHFFGGMVVPTLSMGALLGQLLVSFSLWSGVSHASFDDLSLILLVSMLAFYASVSSKPFVSFALLFSFARMDLVLLPGLVGLTPVAITLLAAKEEGLSKAMDRVDQEADSHGRPGGIPFRNFLRI